MASCSSMANPSEHAMRMPTKKSLLAPTRASFEPRPTRTLHKDEEENLEKQATFFWKFLVYPNAPTFSSMPGTRPSIRKGASSADLRHKTRKQKHRLHRSR